VDYWAAIIIIVVAFSQTSAYTAATDMKQVHRVIAVNNLPQDYYAAVPNWEMNLQPINCKQGAVPTAS